MSDFPAHDVESAPEKSKPLLENSLKGFGMIPGLHAVMAEAPLPNEKLEALRTFTLAVMNKNGNVSREDLEAFYDAGYKHRQVLEVILVLSQKTMSNYINHIAETPVDEAFKKFAWKKNS